MLDEGRWFLILPSLIPAIRASAKRVQGLGFRVYGLGFSV